MKFWKLSLTALALAMVTGTATAQDDALFNEIMRAYEAINTAYNHNDTATIETLVTPDHVSITAYYDGAMGLTEQLAVDDQLIIDEHSMEEIVISRLTDDLALQRYVSVRSGSFRGEPLAERVYITILWKLEDGVWRDRLYQETPLP
jgi:hypothetical protein